MAAWRTLQVATVANVHIGILAPRVLERVACASWQEVTHKSCARLVSLIHEKVNGADV